MTQKVKFTVKPNQNTKRYFMYYESIKPNKKIEAELLKVAKKRGYDKSHKIFFKNKDKIRGSDYIEI
jgi:lipocalin